MRVIFLDRFRFVYIPFVIRWNFNILHKESVPENNAPKVLWNFELQTDFWTPAGRPDFGINKKNKKIK